MHNVSQWPNLRQFCDSFCGKNMDIYSQWKTIVLSLFCSFKTKWKTRKSWSEILSYTAEFGASPSSICDHIPAAGHPRSSGNRSKPDCTLIKRHSASPVICIDTLISVERLYGPYWFVFYAFLGHRFVPGASLLFSRSVVCGHPVDRIMPFGQLSYTVCPATVPNW